MTRIIPSRPKRPAEETLSSPFRTPKAPTQFSSAYTPEEEYVSSMFNIEPKATLTRRPEDLPIMQPVYKQSAYDNTDHEGPSHRPQGSLMWPSEMYGRYSTAWLVSPSTDQSSDNSPLLRTEIQAHRITREMLQATEQRRLEAVQSCQRLHIDLRNWSVAYSNIYHILGKRDEEISRQRADNEALKERLRDLGVWIQTLHIFLHLHPDRCCRTRVLTPGFFAAMKVTVPTEARILLTMAHHTKNYVFPCHRRNLGARTVLTLLKCNALVVSGVHHPVFTVSIRKCFLHYELSHVSVEL
jgi:hypothetical protein